MGLSLTSLASKANEFREVSLHESSEMLRQGLPPMVICGEHGTRMFAFAARKESLIAGEWPKVYNQGVSKPNNPTFTLENMDGQVMQGVAPLLFTSEDGILCRIRGVALPLELEPFTVGYLGDGQWQVKGGVQTYVDELYTNPNPNERTIEIADKTVKGDRGWIVLLVRGYQADPARRESNFVPTAFEFQLVDQLSHNFAFTLVPEPGTSSATYGMFPIAWVAKPDVIETIQGPLIYPLGHWGLGPFQSGGPLPKVVMPELFNWVGP